MPLWGRDCPLPALAALACLSLVGDGPVHRRLALLSPLFCEWTWWCLQFSSVQFSPSIVSYSLRPHELQHARPPCPSPSPGVHSDSHPSSPSHPLSSPSPPAANPSQHQSLFQWVNSLHEIAKVLSFLLFRFLNFKTNLGKTSSFYFKMRQTWYKYNFSSLKISLKWS